MPIWKEEIADAIENVGYFDIEDLDQNPDKSFPLVTDLIADHLLKDQNEFVKRSSWSYYRKKVKGNFSSGIYLLEERGYKVYRFNDRNGGGRKLRWVTILPEYNDAARLDFDRDGDKFRNEIKRRLKITKRKCGINGTTKLVYFALQELKSSGGLDPLLAQSRTKKLLAIG